MVTAPEVRTNSSIPGRRYLVEVTAKAKRETVTHSCFYPVLQVQREMSQWTVVPVCSPVKGQKEGGSLAEVSQPVSGFYSLWGGLCRFLILSLRSF